MTRTTATVDTAIREHLASLAAKPPQSKSPLQRAFAQFVEANPRDRGYGDRAIHVLNLAGKLSDDLRLDPKADASDVETVRALYQIIYESHGYPAANTAMLRLREDLTRRGVFSAADARAFEHAWLPEGAAARWPSSLQNSVTRLYDDTPAATYFASGAPGVDGARQDLGNRARDVLRSVGQADHDLRLEAGTDDRAVFDRLVTVVRNTLGVNVATETMLAVGRDMAKRRSPNMVPILKECLPPSYSGALTPGLVALLNGRIASGT